MGSLFSYVVPGVERPSLHLPWAVQNRKYASEVECDSVLNSQSEAYIRSTFYYFMIWSSTKQWEILLVVISKSCLRWYNLYWEVLKLRKSVTNHWVHGSPGLVSRIGRVWGEGGRRNCTYKRGDTIEAWISFNEEHQSLLKWHVPLGWGVFRCERKMRQYPNEGIFSEIEKYRVRRLLRTYWNLVYLLKGFGGSNEAKIGRQQKEEIL